MSFISIFKLISLSRLDKKLNKLIQNPKRSQITSYPTTKKEMIYQEMITWDYHRIKNWRQSSRV